MKLAVELGRLRLANPILVASGTFGYAKEMASFLNLARLGGIIPKTITPQPRQGNPPPRTVETASGMLNSIGLDNDGLDVFRRESLPYLRTLGTAIIANIAGATIAEFVEMAGVLGSEAGLAGLELNISCPNVSGGVDFGIDPKATAELVRKVRATCSLPVIAKLTPNVTDIVSVARAAADAGADAVSLVNTLLGMAINWRKRRPVLGTPMGGLSGPAIKPVALRMVWQVASQVHVPVIGIGGIATPDDVMDFLVAGARAVQVGTATFFDPAVSERLVDGLPDMLRQAGVEDVNAIVGTLKVGDETTAS